MLTIQQLVSDKQEARSFFGGVLKGTPFKGKTYSRERIQELALQAFSLGWIDNDWYMEKGGEDLTKNITADVAQDNSANSAHLNDEALASLYLYKISSCKDRGISWELSLSDLRRLVNRKTCYYTGEKLVRENGHRSRPTLDRVDAAEGYTKENTVVCSFWANCLKNELFEKPNGNLRTDVKSLMKLVSKIKF